MPKKKRIFFIIALTVLLVSVASFSYALWGSNFTQGSANVVNSGCFSISFSDGEAISLDKAYPIKDVAGKGSEGYEFTITNTCTIAASYEVILNTLSTANTLPINLIKAYIDGDKTVEPILLSPTSTATPVSNDYDTAYSLFTDVLSPASTEGGTDGGSKTYNLKLWIDESATTDVAGGSFTGKVSINATTVKTNVLAQRLLSENKVKTDKVSYAQGVPGGYASYHEVVSQDQEFTTSISSTVKGNSAIGTGYTLDDKTGFYTLQGFAYGQSFNNDSIGKYTCGKLRITKCNTLYKIKEVNVQTDNYDYSTTENKTVSLTSNSDKMVGNTFSFNYDTGEFTLQNTIENVTYSDTYNNYYTCNTAETTCTTLYKIITTSNSSVTVANVYTRKINYNYVTKADVYTSEATFNQTSGLYKTEDNEGPTYYFRGNITNNYVQLGTYPEDISSFVVGRGSVAPEGSEGEVQYNTMYEYLTEEEARKDCNDFYQSDFGYETANDCIADIRDESVKKGDPILWRVMRINGDGNIRLITDKHIGFAAYGTAGNGYGSGGYTYNNSAPNVQDGTPSLIKTLLDTWYNNNLVSYDDILMESTYCNDTYKLSNGGWVFDRATLIESYNESSLKCSETNQNFGGIYRLKIGLPSADELLHAGLSYDEPFAQKSNYLMSGQYFWTMTPLLDSGSGGNITQFVGGIYGDLTADWIDNDSNQVRPVISLKNDVTITSGNGSKTSPFIIATN